ncbi:hypothetical protein CLOM_g22405 [Closterium sp. NIES-68]|nr:hypothetical protein CLOM_g22405 [Closterium sp. NIES-68]GJP77846.1 hypothetical protein CLOP_g8181 [Closterium sp. NIES-67]
MDSAAFLASAAFGSLTAARTEVASVTAASDDKAVKCCVGFDVDCDNFGQDLAALLEDMKRFRLRNGSGSFAERRVSVAIRVQDQQEVP